MRLLTFSAENLPRQSWSALTRDSVYSSPEFARLWRTMNGRERFYICEPVDKPPAGMAGIVFGRGFLKRFQSMPEGFEGGPFFEKGCDNNFREQFKTEIIRKLKSELIIKADIHNPQEIEFDDVFEKTEYKRHLIHLHQKPHLPPRREVVKQIRAARKREARVTLFNDKKYLDEIFRLVIKTERRHNKEPRYSKQFFSELLKLSMKDKRILWVLAMFDDKIIGYYICFIDQTRLFTWQFYSDKKYSRLKPGYLLLDYIINFAQDNNIKSIDLGWSPPNALSLINYKERWGGVAESCTGYTYYNRLGKIIYRWK